MPDVTRITVAVIRQAWKSLSTGSPYFIYERGTGKDNVPGCALRIQRSSVQIGTRADRGATWISLAEVRPDIDVQALDDLRLEVRQKIRELEDEQDEPSLRDGRRMRVRELHSLFRAHLVQHRAKHASLRTLEHYDDLWDGHLLPLIGELYLKEVTVQVATEVKQGIPDRVRSSRPWAEGRHTANHALQQACAAFNWARKRGLVIRNPFDPEFVMPYEVTSAERYLEDHEVAAVGLALREAEALAAISSPHSRHVPALGSLCALRIAIYTGCRHREELLHGCMDWLRDPAGPIPRLEIPRAKGQRGGKVGRVLYLGPHSVQLLLAIPRSAGSRHLLVPGRITGKPLYRLNETWTYIAARAQISDAPPKAWRHTTRTNHVRAGIPPEHSEQLLGHRGRPITDTVYLHRHGPSLVQAAAQYEEFIRNLLGDHPALNAASQNTRFRLLA